MSFAETTETAAGVCGMVSGAFGETMDTLMLYKFVMSMSANAERAEFVAEASWAGADTTAMSATMTAKKALRAPLDREVAREVTSDCSIDGSGPEKQDEPPSEKQF